MFGSAPIKSGLSFGKVIGGISKTLSIANQVIPLYQQAKPMINNAKTIMSVLKGITSKSKEAINITNNNDTINPKINKNHNTTSINNFKKNQPTFFQ